MSNKAEAAAQAKAAKDRVLPNKEAGLFRQLLQAYELKQHKQGIKTADQILKKLPNHGETLAIKALVIHSSLPHNHPTATSQPKGEESERLVAAALRKDPYSHITHHVNSIILRANKDFTGAAESLARARAIDPDNVPLIRDSISLSTHLGNYEEAQEAQVQYSRLRPNMKQNWIALAVGFELCGDRKKALEAYEQLRLLSKESAYEGVEGAELSMHVIQLLIDEGDYSTALAKLRQDIEDKVLPSTTDVMYLEAQICQKTDQNDKADEQYRRLIESNPDNAGYYKDLLSLRGINMGEDVPSDVLPKMLVLLDGFAMSYPKASVPRRMALEAVKGDEFQSRLKPYMRAALEKGIPSLFSDLKGLYRDQGKQKIAESLALEFKSEYEAKGHESEPLLWTYYYLALNYSHSSHPSRDFAQALTLINLAQKRHPAVPELPFARAHVLKRAGDVEGAARALEEARLMDKSDRFLNGKSGKYWLRAGNLVKASEVLGLFTKKDAPTPGADLKDMQCTWFMLEEGDAYRRAGNLPLAVKRYEEVVAIFQEFEDDEYDFHTYSLRKITLNAYMQMIKFHRSIRTHPRFLRAVRSAAEVYMQIYDNPESREVKLSAEEEAEKRKAAKKAQKAGSKAKKATTTAVADAKKEEPTLPDADPTGAQYLKDVDPLQATEKLAKHLLANPDAVAWNIELDLALRQKQYSRALRAVTQASSLDSDNARLHEQIVSLALLLQGKEAEQADKSIIEAFGKFVPKDLDVLRYNAEYMQKHHTASGILSSARSLYTILLAKSEGKGLDQDDKRQVEEALLQVVSNDVRPDLQVYKAALAYHVSPLESSEESRKTFLSAVRSRLPLGYDFADLSTIVARREAWAKEDAAKAMENGANGKNE